MNPSLLVTKLHRPALPAKQVERPHLIQLLSEGLEEGRGLTLVSAPAGFGKTTCISEWIENHRFPAAWLSLDKSDNDPIRFFRYFLAALEQVDPNFSSDLKRILAAGELPPEEIITNQLVNNILELPDKFLLILDDFQVIQDRVILKILETLLANQPRQLHLVLITREDPLLPLARLRANNLMTEIRASDLRFNDAEVFRFLNTKMGLSLSSEDVSKLESRTEGWIAGLQLAGLSIRSQSNPSLFIDNLSGSHRFILNYLTEEVLHQLPAEIQTFLLQTSILDRLNGDLCDAITGRADSRRLLEQLYNANLFLVPLDHEQNWYRYHHLFRDILQNLQSRLPKEMISDLHLRASRWYEGSERASEAIEHALASEHYDWAVVLLEKYAMQTLSKGYAKTVESWMQAIPEEFRSQNPKANLAFAWMHLLRGSYDKIDHYHKIIQPAFPQGDTDPDSKDEPSHLLLAEWLAFQSNYSNVRGKPDESIAFAQKALGLIPADNHTLLSLAYLGLGGSYRLKGVYAKLIDAYQKASHHSVLSSNIIGEMLAVSAITLTSIQYGRLHFAIASGLPVIDRFKNSASLPPPIMGTVYGSVGLVYYEWNQLDQAHEHFKKSMHLASLVGHNAGLVYSEMIMSRYSLAVGDLPATERAIQEAARLLEFGVPAWLRPEVTLQQVRLHLIQENPAAAEAVIQKYEAAAPPHMMISLARLRLLHYFGTKKGSSAAITEGKVLAQKVIDTGLQQQRIGVVLQALLLRAQMGSRSESAADMTKAIELAEPEGYIRTFLDEGSAIANLLAQHAYPIVHREYLHTLLRAFGETIPNTSPIHGSDSGVDPLSDREVEVLRLMAQGLKYEEIAGELVITLNTVRFHVKQIYRKLNANNRTSAIETARKLDLL